MKKLLFFFVLFLILIVAAGCVGRSGVQAPSENYENNKPAETAFEPIIKSAGGIEVSINSVKRENGLTTINLSLGNHQYDLSSMPIKEHSSLAGRQPFGYKVESSAIDGHHIQLQMVFKGELSGPLTIGLNQSLNFDFNIQ